jgi:hypothetical protein
MQYSMDTRMLETSLHRRAEPVAETMRESAGASSGDVAGCACFVLYWWTVYRTLRMMTARRRAAAAR